MVYEKNDKKSLRQLFRETRRNFPLNEKMQADKQIHDAVLSQNAVRFSKCICIYASLPDEVDTIKIMKQLLKMGKSVIIPKVISEGFLKLYLIHSFDDLSTGVFGIPEPDIRCTYIQKKEVDVFIVPGIVFDRKGIRLGWGKGYYDRLLVGTEGHKIGLAYSCQIVPRLPHEKYDIPMDAVITEKESLEF